MQRTNYLLIFVAVILAGCTGFGSATSMRPSSPSEMQTVAASIVGRDINNSVPIDAYNPNPVIDLPPSPGKAPLIGQIPVEALRSDPISGAYIAFVGQVPPTKYFEVVRRADCDDWLYLQFITVDMIINRPGYYGSGHYTGDKAALKCAGVFHRKFRDKSDDRLIGTDGVIFDHESAVFTDTEGWFNSNRKLHMNGWAVKFYDPTIDVIRYRLAIPVTSAIDIVQLRAAAFWIEKNHASELATDLRRILPFRNLSTALSDWRGSDLSLFRALASVEDSNESDDVFRLVLDAGIAKMLRRGSETTVASAVIGEAPFIAANIIVCRNQHGAKEELRKVLLQATIRQHKLASAKGLIALGDSEFVRVQLGKGSLGDLSTKIMSMLAASDIDPFTCPYRSKVSAQS